MALTHIVHYYTTSSSETRLQVLSSGTHVFRHPLTARQLDPQIPHARSATDVSHLEPSFVDLILRKLAKAPSRLPDCGESLPKRRVRHEPHAAAPERFAGAELTYDSARARTHGGCNDRPRGSSIRYYRS